MRLFNATPKQILAKVAGRKPVNVGMEEMRFAPRVITLLPGVVTEDVAEADGLAIMQRYGEGGVVVAEPGESDEVLAVRGRKVRETFLRARIVEYRNNQARRKAANLEIELPTPQLEGYMEELTAMHEKYGVQSPALTRSLPGLPGLDLGTTPKRDVIGEEVEKYGIPREAVPVAPGVPNELLGIA